jgi:hypothetical protein
MPVHLRALQCIFKLEIPRERGFIHWAVRDVEAAYYVVTEQHDGFDGDLFFVV